MNVSWTKDRGTLATGGALLVVVVAAWLGVVGQATMPMPAGAPMEVMVEPAKPAAAAALGFVVAWLVMMVAMMLPSAAPMVLLYRTLARARERYLANLLVALFVAGYLLVWGGFGLLVYLASYAVAASAGAIPAIAQALPFGTAGALIIAGLYQLTPLKAVCLSHCQSPLHFLMHRWRPGAPGALLLGVDHGLYCLGCCWALMVVLVAVGAMALAWVVVLALVVFLEKLLPRGETTARIVGGALLALGLGVALRPDLAMLLRPMAQGMGG